MKYQPSKLFLWITLPASALIVCLWSGLLPELSAIKTGSIPGEIHFTAKSPPVFKPAAVSTSRHVDWLQKNYKSLMEWQHNPWKSKPEDFGGHYFKMLASKDPLDQARCAELHRIANAFYEQLLLRYPDLAIAPRVVPDDQNGFLAWLNFIEKHEGEKANDYKFSALPKELSDYIRKSENGPTWDPTAARAFLATQKSLLDDVRAIGLIPDESINGIKVDRWAFTPARFVINCTNSLMIEARLAVDEGDIAGAMNSIRAAKGLADHLTEIETPSLLGATIQILSQRSLENFVLSEIIPALPANERDAAAWETILNPTVSQPAEFARLMKGEWSIGVRQYLLPILLDAGDPDTIPDPGELLDVHASHFLETVRTHEKATLADLPTLSMPPESDVSHLSRRSRAIAGMFTIGAGSWRKGWDRVQSEAGLTRAAFAILTGKPIPKEPVFGKDYRWNPATRQLSMPDEPEFESMNIDPIVVPK